jgi:HEAT repeat protein
LRDKYSDVQKSTASALEKINPNWHATEEAKKQVPEFIAALRDKNEDVRKSTASALEKINPNWHATEEAKKQVPEFITALGDKNEDVREAAASALGEIGDKRAVEPLIAALRDEVWRVRKEAASALGEIGDKRAVEPLITALGDKDSDVRKEAAYALGKVGDKKAIPALVLHLRDWYAGDHVADALDELGWQPTTDDEKIHYLVAKRKVNELKKMWDITKRVLLKDIESNSNDYRVMENAVYALLYIVKIQEVIQKLIDILNKKGTKEMAKIYL